ncbi:fimbrial biogenesis chaperone [Ignatzschineria sp. LJL83]
MKKILFFSLFILNFAFAQISFDRTRVILDMDKSKSQTITAINPNKTLPFLAQSWIEDEKGNKITQPLIALPIVQRLNPGQEKQIKVELVGNASSLPTDRESLYYFNALGVPPKDGGQNQVNIVIQSKLKLFYRPKGLPKYPQQGWVEELQVQKTSNGLTIQNPTAYHVIIYGFSSTTNKKLQERDIILKPFSTEKVNVKLGNGTPIIHIVNDQGGAKSINFSCNTNDCRVITEERK